jgi:hypothetical protein
VTGEPVLAAICHCTMCRKAHAAPAVAWAMFEDSNVQFSGAAAKAFRSSPEARRMFCGECGTQVAFAASFLPGLIDVPIGSLDQSGAIEPSMHYWYDEHLRRAEFADALPRHPAFPPFADGEA